MLFRPTSIREFFVHLSVLVLILSDGFPGGTIGLNLGHDSQSLPSGVIVDAPSVGYGKVSPFLATGPSAIFAMELSFGQAQAVLVCTTTVSSAIGAIEWSLELAQRLKLFLTFFLIFFLVSSYLVLNAEVVGSSLFVESMDGVSETMLNCENVEQIEVRDPWDGDLFKVPLPPVDVPPVAGAVVPPDPSRFINEDTLGKENLKVRPFPSLLMTLQWSFLN